MDNATLLLHLVKMAQEIITNDKIAIDANTPLLGGETMVSSRELVELLLAIEDFAESDLKIKFDWTNDQAMSTKRSNLRTLSSINDYLMQLQSKAA